MIANDNNDFSGSPPITSRPFLCDLDGQQKLQIWRLDTNAWHPHEDIHHLTPKETRFYCRGEPRAAGFPYSPYFSGQHGQDLLNTVQKLRDKI